VVSQLGRSGEKQRNELHFLPLPGISAETKHPFEQPPQYAWSNGAVEGRVHRLKLIKRPKYGGRTSISCAFA
jgi:hypothetical protein